MAVTWPSNSFPLLCFAVPRPSRTPARAKTPGELPGPYTNFRRTPPQEATRALREALYLAPHHARVQDAFAAFRERDGTPDHAQLLQLCTAFAATDDRTSAEEALWFLGSGAAAALTADAAGQCVDAVVDCAPSAASVRLRDDLAASLVSHCPGARIHVAAKLQKRRTPVFQQLFNIGDGAANGLTVVTLDRAAWPNEAARLDAERDVFLLFLAKLLESDCEYDGRALKGISRHLVADAPHLHVYVDEGAFEAILYCLDYRQPHDVRSQATLATAKYLEASGAAGEAHLTAFITARMRKHATEDLVKGFSVAAAVFPIVTPVVAKLLLTEGLLASLVPLLDKKSRPVKVEKAALDMLSAACIDPACRAAIAKHCSDWIHHVMDDEADERHGQAAVILAKVQGESTNGAHRPSISTNGSPAGIPRIHAPGPTSDSGASAEGDSDSVSSRRSSKAIDEVLPTLKTMLLTGDDINRRTAVEGLAFASTRPAAKDQIIRDPALLRALLTPPGKDAMTPAAAFGALSLLDNLTRYLPPQTEEMKKMAELKAYANAAATNGEKSAAAEPDVRDQDAQVDARCQWLLDAKAVPYLLALKASFATAQLSPASLALLARILRSLARRPASRGTLAQQGAIPLLLALLASETPAPEPAARFAAAHALARILISTNPALVPAAYLANAVAPLLSLLADPESDAETSPLTPTPAHPEAGGGRDLLPTYEALLALTNLASYQPGGGGGGGGGPAEAIARGVMPGAMDDLLLSGNVNVQRAAVELVCNLAATSEAGLRALTLPAAAAPSGPSPKTPTARAANGSTNGVMTNGNSNGATTNGNTDGAGKGQVERRIHVLLALSDSPDPRTRLAASGALVAVATAPDAAGARAIMSAPRWAERALRLLGDEEGGVVHRGVVCVGGLVEADGEARRGLRSAGLEKALAGAAQRMRGDEAVMGALTEVVAMLKGG